MNKTFAIAAVALALISGGYPIQQVQTTHKTIEVGPATVEIERTGSQVSMQVEGIPEDGEMKVERASIAILENDEGSFDDILPNGYSEVIYTFSLESALELESELISQGKIDVKDLDSYSNLDVVTTVLPSSNVYPMPAYASTSLPSRTRFRYQTFIPEASTKAPSIVCTPLPDEGGMPIGIFLGNNRGFDPDSLSYKTRSDVVVDWDAGGTITPEFSVGESTQVLSYVYENFFANRTITTKKTASSESMKLVRGVVSADYVSFHIYSDVINPFCWDYPTRGMFYDFAFYVHRSGVFVVHGTLRQVPNHELYTRNTLVPFWRTIFKSSNSGFGCLAIIFEDCKTEKSVTGDLVP